MKIQAPPRFLRLAPLVTGMMVVVLLAAHERAARAKIESPAPALSPATAPDCEDSDESPTPTPSPRAPSCEDSDDQVSDYDTEPVCEECLVPTMDQILEVCDEFVPPIVEFVVREDGQTANHRFRRATGCDAADDIIMEHVKEWTFTPAKKDGVAVAIEYWAVIHL